MNDFTVRDYVWTSIRVPAWDVVENTVGSSIRNSVWNSVWNSVRDSVWSSVQGSAREYFQNKTTSK